MNEIHQTIKEGVESICLTVLIITFATQSIISPASNVTSICTFFP